RVARSARGAPDVGGVSEGGRRQQLLRVAVGEPRAPGGALPIGAGDQRMRRHRYLGIVPNGVGIRNFFCTPFIDRLLQSGSVAVWHALAPDDIAPFRERWGTEVAWRELPPVRDGLLERLVRQAKIHAQLYWQLRLDPGTPIQPRREPSRASARVVERC